jgi:hypothetical protein
LREQLRNEVFQCFDLTDELSWKMLKRCLEATEASPAELGWTWWTGPPSAWAFAISLPMTKLPVELACIEQLQAVQHLLGCR